MQKQTYCAGLHQNNFQHLNADLGGLESEYDLGFKFEAVEGEAGPYLALDVSVRHRSNNPPDLPVLHYGLSAYAVGLSSSQKDWARLLELARPRIKHDVAAIHAGQSLRHLDRNRPQMVMQ